MQTETTLVDIRVTLTLRVKAHTTRKGYDMKKLLTPLVISLAVGSLLNTVPAMADVKMPSDWH